jgi:transposase
VQGEELRRLEPAAEFEHCSKGHGSLQAARWSHTMTATAALPPHLSGLLACGLTCWGRWAARREFPPAFSEASEPGPLGLRRELRWQHHASTRWSCRSGRCGGGAPSSLAGRSRTWPASWACIPRRLGNWIRQDEADGGERADRLTSEQLEELRRLRKENAELRRTNEILKAASAVFAQELDPTRRRS